MYTITHNSSQTRHFKSQVYSFNMLAISFFIPVTGAYMQSNLKPQEIIKQVRLHLHLGMLLGRMWLCEMEYHAHIFYRRGET